MEDASSDKFVQNDPKIYVPSSTEEARRLINQSVMRRFALREKARLDGHMRFLQANNTDHPFERSHYSDVRAFFDEASKDYDSDLENPYWAFAHEILKFILEKFVAEHFHTVQDIRLFDAGAGTGNWSKFVLGLNEHISGTLFDMNSSMLGVAYSKVAQLHGNLIKIIEGNLEVLSDLPPHRSNLILCMHNVIGLGRNTDLILQNLCSYLEDDGLAFIMATNKYHAFNFAHQFRGEVEALRVVSDGTVKFKSDMPEMFCYTPEEFKETLIRVGFIEVTVLGFPVTVYPSPQDTKLLRKDTFDQRLKDLSARSALLDLEKRICLYPELAYRAGSSLIAICKKSGMT